VDIDAGGNTTCVLRAHGDVLCWGANDFGQLGDGVGPSANTPQLVLLPGPAADITVATSSTPHVCAALQNGDVWCWGKNANMQIGSTSTSSVAKTKVDISDVSGIDASIFNTCARTTGSELYCWGYGTWMGAGSSVDDSADPQLIASGIAAATMGGGHGCALHNTSSVRCWGLNEEFQCGSTGGYEFYTPKNVPGLNNVASVSAGAASTCAVLQDGSAKCWGRNSDGQLGDGTLVTSATPQSVDGPKLVRLAMGNAHALGIDENGQLHGWGSSDLGENGLGVGNATSTPTEVVGETKTMSISAGASHSCLIRTDGSVACWGSNNHGQLGNGTTTNTDQPTDVVLP
jgi:alpha-tubulin suppressor-like RCC1 family protein